MTKMPFKGGMQLGDMFAPPSMSALDRAIAAHRSGDIVQAELLYRNVLAANPNQFDALHMLAIIEGQRANLDKAEELLRHALTIAPQAFEAHANHARILLDMRRANEALAAADRALALNPNFLIAQTFRGSALLVLKEHRMALESFDSVIAIAPDFAVGHYNRGVALDELGEIEEALASYDKALALKPDYAEAHLNKSLLLLLCGKFSAGWEENEWRWCTKESPPRSFDKPQWLGDTDIRGRVILLHAEQGLGDTIQFSRYIAMVAARGARILLEVQPALTPLFEGLPGVERVIARGEEIPTFDLHCPLLSLPLAFKIRLESVPAENPYLTARAADVERWRQRLMLRQELNIGIAWAGNPNFKRDQSRSIGLGNILPLLSTPGARFWGLQKDLRPGDHELLRHNSELQWLGDELRNFADTAAVISLLDLVISSDTSIVHLAGALGKPVWILLPFSADWRWLRHGDVSPWYPTARLFRQRHPGDWADVVARVGAEILWFGGTVDAI